MLKTPQNEVEILRKKLAIRDAEIALNRTNHLNETRILLTAIQEARQQQQESERQRHLSEQQLQISEQQLQIS